MDVSGQHHSPATIAAKSPYTHKIGHRKGLGVGLQSVEKTNMSCHPSRSPVTMLTELSGFPLLLLILFMLSLLLLLALLSAKLA